jgi:hypothetical protein
MSSAQSVAIISRPHESGQERNTENPTFLLLRLTLRRTLGEREWILGKA